MIKVLCTEGEVKVYPTTGITLPEGFELPLVAPVNSDEKIVMEKGESMQIDPARAPAIGGNGGEFEISTDTNVQLIRWHEIDNNPIYADEMQGYLDLEGEHTDENYTHIKMNKGETYSDKTIRSNAITLTMVKLVQPK